jgi:hypothetical protein
LSGLTGSLDLSLNDLAEGLSSVECSCMVMDPLAEPLAYKESGAADTDPDPRVLVHREREKRVSREKE